MEKSEKEKQCYDCLFIQTVILDFIEGTGNKTRPVIECQCGKRYQSGDNEYSKSHGVSIFNNKNFGKKVAYNCAMWLDAVNSDTLLIPTSNTTAILLHNIKEATDKDLVIKRIARKTRAVLRHF